MLAALQQVTLGYGRREIVRNASLQIHAGEICCLLGANGSGKTTLLRALSGLLMPLSGQILLDNIPLHHWSARKLARQLACVPQAHHVPFAFSVLEMVLMGFHSQLGWLATPGKQQRDAAMQALDNLHIAHLATRLFPTLSGGEQQLVLIARALVQQPRLLIMDEPAASLDFANQILLLETLRQLNQQGMTLFMSTHHPLHARSLAHRVVTISRDGSLHSGSGQSLLSTESLAALYQISPESIQRHLAPCPSAANPTAQPATETQHAH